MDLNALRGQLGVSAPNLNINQAPISLNAPAPKANFWGNLGTSIGGALGTGVGVVANSFVAPVEGLGHDISNYLAGNQQQGFNQHTLDQLNSYQQQLQAQRGKISTQRYAALAKDLGNQYMQLHNQTQQTANMYAKPVNFVSHLAGTAAIPFAFGRLAASSKLAGLAGEGNVVGKAGQTAERYLGVSKGAQKGLYGNSDFQVSPEGVVQAPKPIVKPIQPAWSTSVAKAMIKNPLLTQPTAQLPIQIQQDVQNKNYGDLALNAGALAGVGLVAKYLPKVAAAAGSKLFGVRSFLDEIPTKDMKITDYVRNVQDPAEAQKYANIAKTFQQYNLDQSHGDVGAAVHFYKQWMSGIDPAAMTAKQHLDTFNNFVEDVGKVRQAAREGVLPKPGGGKWTEDEIKNLWVGRFDQTVKHELVNSLSEAKTPEARMALAINLAQEQQWGMNENLRAAVIKAAGEDNWKDIINKRLNGTYDLTKTADQASKIDEALSKDAMPIVGDKAKIDSILSRPQTDFVAHQNITPSDEFMRATGGKPVGEPDMTRLALPEHATPAPIIKPASKTLEETMGLSGGHIPIIRERGTEFTSADKSGDIVRGIAPSGAGSALIKAGLSPRATSPVEIHANLKQNFGKRLDEAGVTANQNRIFNALLDKANSVAGANDARMLTINEVKGAISATAPGVDPKIVRAAFAKAVSDIPTELAGLGPKGINRLMSGNSFLAKYLRVQGVARYEWNPTFWAKQDIKSAYVAWAQHGLSKPTQEAYDTLLHRGYFNAQGAKSGLDMSLGSQLGDTFTGNSKAATSLIRKGQQRVLASLAADVAKSHGMTVDEVFNSGGKLAEQMDDMLKHTTGYGNGGVLNSPMMKSLNIAVYPSRFTAKVAINTAKAMGKLNPVAQAVMIHNVVEFGQWLHTSDGQQWQKDNSEMLGLIKYFTPLQEVQNVANFFHHGQHLSDLGEIGGMPLGFVTTVLDHQGVNLSKLGSSQYIDPKTGQPVPEKIPQTAKARLQQGFTDMISSMFSYPGRTAGLGSKTDLIQTAVPALKPAASDVKKEFKPDYKAAAPADTTGKSFLEEHPPLSNSTNQFPTSPSTLKIEPKFPAGTSRRAKSTKIVPANLRIL